MAIIAEGSNFLHFSALAFIMVFFVVRVTKNICAAPFVSTLVQCILSHNRIAGRMFEKNPILEVKSCPHCAEQVPLSTLICHACEYNFLSGTIGNGRLLTSPEPLVHEMSEQSVA